MTYIVGLTGGIGAGKSTVASLFQDLGVPVIDADEIARECVMKESTALAQIKARFGERILTAKGELNRSLLRDIVFSNLEDKHWLEALLHPEIHARLINKIQQCTSPYCIVVIPLLAESFEKYKDILDTVLVVDASPSLQIERAALRDKSKEAHIQKILQDQATREERLKIAQHVLQNEGNIDLLKEKVDALNQQFLTTSQSTR